MVDGVMMVQELEERFAALAPGETLIYHVGALAYECEERRPNGIHGFSDRARALRALAIAARRLGTPRHAVAVMPLNGQAPKAADYGLGLGFLTQRRIGEPGTVFHVGAFEYRITKAREPQ